MKTKFYIHCNLDAQLQMLSPEEKPVLEKDDLWLDLTVKNEGAGLAGYGKLIACAGKLWDTAFYDNDISDGRYSKQDMASRKKEIIRILVLNLLKEYTGKKEVPWGILTGVRPAKLINYLRQKGFSTSEINEKLLVIYCLSRDKSNLLFEIERQQAGIKPEIKKRPFVSIFINIPFCPSRCFYCSFPGYPLSTHGHLVKRYLSVLRREMQLVGDILKEKGLKIDSIYCGGGTPTVLCEEDFSALLKDIQCYLLEKQNPLEVTIESGRPETLTQQKLILMKKIGVTRICVNPQTWKQETLERIGRNHTIRDIEIAVKKVKKIRFDLNMDLIAGLPGESPEDFARTLERTCEFQPENITIHTLALKKASKWRANFSVEPFSLQVRKMLTISQDYLAKNKYLPYYLYRQKFIAGNAENTGYAVKGKFCRYNIAMMEEVQEIIGIGAGAVTRLESPDGKLFRIANAKCPATYCNMALEYFGKKAKIMSDVFC